MCDDEGRPIVMMLTEGQMSDHKGAVLLFDALLRAKELLGDTEGHGKTRRLGLTCFSGADFGRLTLCVRWRSLIFVARCLLILEVSDL